MEKTGHRILDWKGLLHAESKRTKVQVFAALLIISTCMTFTQFGFIGIGPEGDYLGYALGLLGPIAAAALLLGKGPGSLLGLLAGAVLLAHSRVQPLDLFERYLVSFRTPLLYMVEGFSLGLLFAIALHNDPQGKRRAIYLAIACLVSACLASLTFYVDGFANAFTSLVTSYENRADPGQLTISSDWLGVLDVVGGGIQVPLDFILMFGVCLFTNGIARRKTQNLSQISVRTSFREQLLVVVILVFLIVQALSYTAITHQAKRAAFDQMGTELDYLDKQIEKRMSHRRALLSTMVNHNVPEETMRRLLETESAEDVLDGYNLSDGTILIFDGDVVDCSYNPAFPAGKRAEDLFDTYAVGTLEKLCNASSAQMMVYDTNARTTALDSLLSDAQIGYMRVKKDSGGYILMAMPSSMVFADRLSTMQWASVIAFVLLATVYVLAAQLLNKDVVSPIDRTNASLALITSGNLDEIVDERDSIEFASLSKGINTTVDALKGWIAEAESRMEGDLITAKAIQESALPRVFPPFPEVGAFDIFASMDAAKEVGGDFFDFFLIDDHTLGFLIADVSGKGIPGALFMMAAKTEIENYLSTGMNPDQAIATANKRLCASNDAGMFVTVWAATLNWETGLLTYVNAGHNPPLLRHGAKGSWEWLRKRCGIFLGTFETAKYRQETLTLESGDELLLYTDGVNEAFNINEEEYGNDRLEAFVSTHAHMHPRELVRALRADVARWANGAEQSDDVTILALEYGVAPEVTGSIKVPATLDHLGDAIALVSGELERRLCPLDVQHKVEVALEELFVNICSYAYKGQDEPGSAQVSYAYVADPSSITVELRDQGIPFDPLQRKDPTKPSSIQETKVGGLGIFMVKKTMDDFIYMRDDDTNVVVFKKGW